MLVLDTDHLSLLEWADSSTLGLQMRLGRVDPEEVVTTMITYEEQMRGWLARNAQANTTAKMLIAYERMLKHIETLRDP